MQYRFQVLSIFSEIYRKERKVRKDFIDP